jgi:hypothetical protein
MPPGLVLEVDEETSGFALEAGFDEQIPGSFSCMEMASCFMGSLPMHM